MRALLNSGAKLSVTLTANAQTGTEKVKVFVDPKVRLDPALKAGALPVLGWVGAACLERPVVDRGHRHSSGVSEVHFLLRPRPRSAPAVPMAGVVGGGAGALGAGGDLGARDGGLAEVAGIPSGAAAGGAVDFVMEVDGVGSSGVVGLSLVGTESPATSAAEAAAMVAWPPTVVVGSDVCAAAVAAEGGCVVGDVVESRVALPEWGLRAGDQGVVEWVHRHQPDRVFVDWGGGPFIAFVDEVMFVRGGGALLAG